MREADETTRQRLADHLRQQPSTPSALANEFALSVGAIMGHLEHVSQSVDGSEGEQFLVAPPTCRACGFDGFDDLLNIPSRCPSCKGESVEEPAFTIG